MDYFPRRGINLLALIHERWGEITLSSSRIYRNWTIAPQTIEALPEDPVKRRKPFILS